MIKNRASWIGGLVLIAVGLVFLANLFFPGAWALLLVGLGLFFLAASVIWHWDGLTTSGTTNLVLGAILLYQSITQDWSSWFYLWPLLYFAAGAGMLLVIPLRPQAGWTGGRYRRAALSFTLLGLAATAVLWLVRAQLTWPVIIWGMGALFALAAITSGIGPLLIPGTILGGLGALLAYQNASGDWASWAYAWALIPAFVGLGLFLAFIRRRVMRIIGLSMLSWSVVFFTIFGLVFARQGQLARFWPVALIVAGVVILAQALLVKRPARMH